RDTELALAAVDEQEVGRVREALALAGTFVALLEVPAEPAREHLLHRREVVLTLLTADLEAPVVGALGEAVLHDDHRADDLGPLEVRDVEALDPQRRLGEGERVLERGQGPRARVVITRSLELVARECLTGVVGHSPEQLTLRPPLRDAHAHA